MNKTLWLETKTPNTPSEITRFNSTIFDVKTKNPDFGSEAFRFWYELVWKDFKEFVEGKDNKEELPIIKNNPVTKVLLDKIEIPNKNVGHKEIRFSFLYEIENEFHKIGSIFKIGYNLYFLSDKVVLQDKQKYNAIYRLNREKWIELVTGARFNIVADMWRERVLGLEVGKPSRLYGFNWSYSKDFHFVLQDFRFRQGIYRLNHNHFIFHNFRINPDDYAVEIYNISGKREKECFDYVPYHIKTQHKIPLATQTVLTTDQRGHFFIGFTYPINPYRIWKYNQDGRKIAILGNYLVDPGIYTFPEEWIEWSLDNIKGYGLRRIYSINKLLTDEKGRLFVFISMNRHQTQIQKRMNLVQKKEAQKYFFDIYSNKGKYIGRKDFSFGIPELIHNHKIYSRKKESEKNWKITVVGIKIE
jgi:hypothetical protein